MKYLNKDDKEFFAIIGGILFITIGFIVAIFTTIRANETKPQKHYIEECTYTYVKLQPKECIYKEVE